MSGDVVDSRVKGQEFAHTGNLRGLTQSLEGNSFGNLLEVGFVELSNHVRFDESRADGVDDDSSGGEFLGVRHTHCDDTSLGGGVVGLPRVSELSDDGGDVDDTAGSLLGGELEEGLRAVENSAEVAVDDILPGVWLHSHDETITGDSGVVDQDIDGSKGLDGLGEHILDGIRIRSCCFVFVCITWIGSFIKRHSRQTTKIWMRKMPPSILSVVISKQSHKELR